MYRNLFLVLEQAFLEGKKAFQNCKPTPQHFYSADLSDKPLDKGTIEKEGDCGGAYITSIGGNDEIVKFFKGNGKFDGNISYVLSDGTYITKGVYKGYTLHAPTKLFSQTQSAERYAAFYEAYSRVLKENGIKCAVKTYLS